MPGMFVFMKLIKTVTSFVAVYIIHNNFVEK